MSANATRIENIRRHNFRQRFTNEADWLEAKVATESTTERIHQLRAISKSIPDIVIEKPKTKTEHLDEITQLVYHKKWNQMPSFHRAIKAREFITDLVADEETRDKILTEITAYIHEDQMRTKKYVVYDSKEAKIVEMPALTFNSEDNTYSIKL